jgi:photosystem II stability/assembly factor-like uncharacterized protein
MREIIIKIMIHIILLILTVFVAAGYSQGNWELLVPSGTSNQLVSLYFTDGLNGCSVGQYGTIIKTSDGGITWEIIELEYLTDLTDIYFPTETVGYIVGEDGLILKTTDSGDTWDKLINAFSNNLHQVKFRDSENGWAIGEKGLILHTSNGGNTWNQQISDSQGDLYGIHIFDGQKVWIAGDDSTLLVTENDGLNWQMIETDYYDDYKLTYHYKDIYFADDSSGWACGEQYYVEFGMSYGLIAYTFNGGKNWYKKDVRSFNYDDLVIYDTEGMKSLQQIYFKDDLTTGVCLTSGENDDLGNLPLNTLNGGRNWRGYIEGANEDTHFRGRFQFLTDSCVINTGSNGDIRFSDDNGRNWYYNHPEKRFWSDFKIGPENTLHVLQRKPIARTNETEFECKHLISKDKGISWQEVVSTIHYLDGSEEEIHTVFNDAMINLGWTTLTTDERLFTIHQRNKNDTTCSILFSDDMGITYQELHKGDHSLMLVWLPQNLHFLTPDTLIYTEIEFGSQTFYCKTSYNGGVTVTRNFFDDAWNNLTSSIWRPAYINDSFYFNSQTGFVVGDDGNIVKTEDAGQSWENIYSGVVEELWDIEFIDRETGFVVGDFGRILKTEDGGVRWRKTNSGTQEDIYSIAFLNESEGWVGTESGMRYTKDGGETWQGVPLRYQHGTIHNIIFDNDDIGYAYTLSSDINSHWEMSKYFTEYSGSYVLLQRMTDHSTSIHDHERPYQPKTDHIRLYPNYPNPFNSSTRIDYYLPAAGDVMIKIFNISGQLVRTLVSQTKASGHHSVIWDGQSDKGSFISSGIYIYQLQSNNQIKNHKLLLLK